MNDSFREFEIGVPCCDQVNPSASCLRELPVSAQEILMESRVAQARLPCPFVFNKPLSVARKPTDTSLCWKTDLSGIPLEFIYRTDGYGPWEVSFLRFRSYHLDVESAQFSAETYIRDVAFALHKVIHD